MIYLDTVSGIQVAAEVVRTDWDDAQGMFMISCRHAGRSMPPEERGAILQDASWEMKPLI